MLSISVKCFEICQKYSDNSQVRFCATVGLAVESANVVGYASGELRYGFKGVGAQFAAVSGTAIDLTDIKVTGYDEATEGEVSVQVLDAYGKSTMIYSYYDVPGELTGWLDSGDNLIEAGTVTLASGDALWVDAPSEAYNLQTAGQVPTTGIAVGLRYGFKLVSNSTPVSVDLTDIDVSGYDEVTEGEVSVQVLDAYGKSAMIYSYYDVPGELTGWLDSSDNEVAVGDLVIAPGEALWVDAPSTSYSLIFPGVTL